MSTSLRVSIIDLNVSLSTRITVVGTTEGTVVTKGVTGGNGLVAGILGWEPEGGSGVVRLGGKGSDAGLAVY